MTWKTGATMEQATAPAPLDQAKALLQAGPTPEALRAVAALVADHPGNMMLWDQWVKALIQAGDLDSAAQACAALTPDQAATMPAHLAQARLARAKADPDAALIHARRAFDTRATVDSRLMLADALAATGDRPAALALLNDGLAQVNAVAFHQKRVRLLIAEGRRPAALAAAEAWVAAAPKSDVARTTLETLRTGKDTGKTSGKRGPSPAPSPRYADLTQKLKDGQTGAALSLAQNLLDAGPTTAPDALALARGFAGLNRRDLECQALSAARAAGLWTQALTDHLLDRAQGYMPPDDLRAPLRSAPRTSADVVGKPDLVKRHHMPLRPSDTARAISAATCVRDCRKLSASRAMMVTLTPPPAP